MQPRSFYKRQLTSIALMLDEEAKNTALSDKEACVFTSSKIQTNWLQIVNDFWDLWNFPNYIGVIDGKHVKVPALPNSGSEFFNYRHSFSVVLLTMINTLYKFTVIVIGSYGRNIGRDFCTLKTWEIFKNSSSHSGRQTATWNIMLSPSSYCG
jgi:hypothetical protein